MILDTIQKVREYLVRDYADIKDIQKLSGGNANYVYRVTLQDKSVVLKNYPPFASSNPAVKLSLDRYFVEKEALTLLGGTYGSMTIPKLLKSDDDAYVIIMEDFGKHQTLMQHLKSGNELDSKWVVQEIKKFLDKISTVKSEVFMNPAAWTLVNGYQIPLQIQKANEYGLTQELQDYLNKPSVQPEDAVLSVGDLWPNSILLDGSRIALVDFEVVRYRAPSEDIEQLMANLWVMKQSPLFDNLAVSELMQTFIEEYGDWRTLRSESKEYFIKFVLTLLYHEHFGITDQRSVMLQALKEVESLI